MRSAKIMLFGGLLLALLLLISGAGLARESGRPSGTIHELPSQPANPAFVDAPDVLYNIPLNLPAGSRLDYLRLYYYDTSPADSTAWITRYDGLGGFVDIVYVSSTGQSGYGLVVSTLIPSTEGVANIVDNTNYSYVLNWRPNTLGSTMQLCGLRVAYRLPVTGGFDTNFSYKYFAGTALRPRDSSPWRYGGTGCVFTPYRSFLPIEKK